MPKYAPPSPPYLGPPKWHGGTGNKPITRLVIHATVGAEPGVKGAARATVAGSKRTSRPSSYHYCVDSAEAVQYAYDSVIAYHAPPNEHSLGIELCCSLSNEGRDHWQRADHQAMLQRAATLVAQLALAYDVPIVRLNGADLRAGRHGICGHVDVRDAWHQTDHWDPGPHFPWVQFMRLVRAEADKIRKPVPPVPPTPPKPDPSPWPSWRDVFRRGDIAHVVRGVPYLMVNSLRGLRAAAKAGKHRADRDLQMTSDGVVVVTHWARPLMPHGPRGHDVFIDPLGRLARTRTVASMTWAEVSRLRTKSGGYRINRLAVDLEEAGKLGLGVVLEPKTPDVRWQDPKVWRTIVGQAKAANVPTVTGYVLPANRGAVPAMRAAGIPTKVLPR